MDICQMFFLLQIHFNIFSAVFKKSLYLFMIRFVHVPWLDQPAAFYNRSDHWRNKFELMIIPWKWLAWWRSVVFWSGHFLVRQDISSIPEPVMTR